MSYVIIYYRLSSNEKTVSVAACCLERESGREMWGLSIGGSTETLPAAMQPAVYLYLYLAKKR